MRIKCVAWTLAAPSSLRMAEGIRLIVMSCYQRLRTAAECIRQWVYAHKVVAYRSEMDRRYRGRAQLRYLEHIAAQYATVSGASSFFTRRRGTPDNYRVLDGFMRINTGRDRQCASSPDLEGIASQRSGPHGIRHRRACSIDGSDASMRSSLPKFMRTNSPPSKQPPSTIERGPMHCAAQRAEGDSEIACRHDDSAHRPMQQSRVPAPAIRHRPFVYAHKPIARTANA
ncbi:hypothetical protein BTE28158_01385 [Burkholderia territorii]|nr:hypothetical protein BTE28158_01385 [Burkholderia territorii]